MGAGISLAGWTVPGPIATYLHLLSAAASPCALISLGLFIADRPRDDGASREQPGLVVALSATKLVAQPLLTLGFCRLLNLPRPATEAAVLIAALPTGTGPYMLAELYGLHAARTAQVILWTTLASLVTVPIVLALMR
jgi:predicted permease